MRLCVLGGSLEEADATVSTASEAPLWKGVCPMCTCPIQPTGRGCLLTPHHAPPPPPHHRRLEAHLQQCMQVAQRVQQVQDSIATDSEYLKKVRAGLAVGVCCCAHAPGSQATRGRLLHRGGRGPRVRVTHGCLCAAETRGGPVQGGGWCSHERGRTQHARFQGRRSSRAERSRTLLRGLRSTLT